jgi:tetratricopeptide (TPR) repeat protein
MPKKPFSRSSLSRRQKRSLDIEIGFLEGLVQKAPDFVDALSLLGDDYTRRGRAADGLKIDLQLARLRPDDPTVFYNLACSYCLTRRYDDAVQALDHALSLGYRDFYHLARDPHLKPLRTFPPYRKLRAKIRLLKAAGKED